MSICATGVVKNILNGDNIKHVISISDLVNGIRQIIPIDNINITASYYTEGSLITYTASKIGSVYTNCILDAENNKLRVILENYTLENGLLYCNIQIAVPDTDYPDGYANYTRQICLNIYLTDANDITL